MSDKILVVGACGRLGTELCFALRAHFGSGNVIAADIKNESGALKGTGPFLQMDIMDKEMLQILVRKHKVAQIYLLSAMHSDSAEQYPHRAWHLNMQSLLNTLEVARLEKLQKVFWPSAIDALDPRTAYGISKLAGEHWCRYYFERFGVDVRSLRFPGLIAPNTRGAGGIMDYVMDMFREAVIHHGYTCYLEPETVFPLLYMPDAVRAVMELMEAPADAIKERGSYTIAGIHFSPQELADEISLSVRPLEITYLPDHRQNIAESWPTSINDSAARIDWGWKPGFDLKKMTRHILEKLLLNQQLLV
jgi:nucleoside-diphosphate-sugar epimerase